MARYCQNAMQRPNVPKIVFNTILAKTVFLVQPLPMKKLKMIFLELNTKILFDFFLFQPKKVTLNRKTYNLI